MFQASGRAPVLRQKLIKFIGFERVDAREDIGVPINRIDTIAFSGGDKREMNGDGFGSFIGARKQAVFPYQHPDFNSPFGRVVINRDCRIFEKSGESQPVFESVVYGYHQLVRGRKNGFGADDVFSQLLDQGLRFAAAHCQSNCCSFVFDLVLNVVQVSVDIQDDAAQVVLTGFEVFTPRMSATAGLRFGTISKQGIKAAGSVSLNGTAERFEKLGVFVKRQVGREVEHCHPCQFITNVGGDFAFADVVFVFAILNLDRGIVSFDDGGPEQAFFQASVKKPESAGGSLHPPTLSGAGDGDIVATEDLLLPIIGEPIVEFADNDFSEQARASIAARNGGKRFLCRDDVLFTFGASASFLKVFNDFQAGADHLQFVSQEVRNKLGVAVAVGTNRVFRFDRMSLRVMRNIFCVLENVFDACCSFVIRSVGSFFVFLSRGDGRSRIVVFSFLAVVTLITPLGLRDELIDFGFQLSERFALLVIAFDGFLKLALQGLDDTGKALNFSDGVEVFLLPLRKVVFHLCTALGVYVITLYYIVYTDRRAKISSN